MLICNLTLIIKGALHPEKPPSFLGIIPLIAVSGSMSGIEAGHIEPGDLIFVRKTASANLKIGDVISFMDGNIVVTHRIVEVQQGRDAHPLFITKGDANNAEDLYPVSSVQILGICIGRLPKAGDFALFLQTTPGMVLFIGVPILLFLLYDITFRQAYIRRKEQETAALELMLTRLKNNNS